MSEPNAETLNPENTHYGVISFSGDPAGEHPDEYLRGQGPHLEVIAQGPEEFCWRHLQLWTAIHPLRLWESAEVLTRTATQAREFQQRKIRPHNPGHCEPRGVRAECVCACAHCLIDQCAQASR